MRILKDTYSPRTRKRIVRVEIGADDKLVAFNPSRYYKLGEPMHEDVMPGFMFIDVEPTSWCPIEQRWV